MKDSFEYYFESDRLHLKYARSIPAVRGDEYHDYDEFVFFLGGDVRFISNDIQKQLQVGNIVLIPKGSFHQFVVMGEDYTRCILGFYKTKELDCLVSSVMSEIKIIEQPTKAVQHLMKGLIDAAKCDMPPEEKGLYLYASMIHLLAQFKTAQSGIISKNSSVSKIVHDAISIIDAFYKEPLTVEEIAKRLCVSPSLLSHKFKKEMSVSVYQYVIKKRLYAARERIRSGVPVTEAALQCGFPDYSCFLRIYKRHYRDLPSVQANGFLPYANAE